jgi:ribosomal protein S3
MKVKTYAMPLQKTKRRRLVIYAKDVENIMGRKSCAARRLLSRIRKKFGKEKEASVTVREFSLYTGIPEEAISELLND